MSVRPSNGAFAKTLVAAGAILLAVLGLAATPQAQEWLSGYEQYRSARDAVSFSTGVAAVPSAPRVEPEASPAINAVLETHLAKLRTQNLLASDQGVLVETLDGEPLVAYNARRVYNPASVLKLVTTLVALERLPADHRFTTAVTVSGLVVDGVVQGDLGIRSDGDPTFDASALIAAADALKAQGIRRVAGALVVSGPFSYKTIDETPAAIARAHRGFGNVGIKIDGGARAGTVEGTELVVLRSRPLLDILQLMNAHSINTIADNLATTVGGATAIRRHLVEELGLPAHQVTVTNGSGLDHNALTPEGVVAVVRALVVAADRRGVPRDQLLPLSGVDSGTMRARLDEASVRGSVIAKTGTQPNVDGGVATLAGVAYTRERGPVLFAIMNSNGDVHNYRNWEDAVLRDVLDACGGAEPIGRVENTVPSRPLGHDVSHVGRASVTTVEETGVE